MSVTIIVPKHGSSMRFHPHMNHALGKYIGTRQEYLSEMKKQGCEPYQGEIKRESKPYKPSPWARGIVNQVGKMKEKDGSVKLTPRMVDEIQSRLVKTPDWVKGKSKGGFHATD